MMMQRHFMTLAIVVVPGLFSPAVHAQGNPICSLTLMGCDFAREEAGVCPTGSSVAGTLWSEGESWYLDTFGMTHDPADSSAEAEDRLRLYNGGSTAEGTRAYFIIGRPGLDGVLLLGQDGAASATLVGDAGPDRTPFEKTYIGTCEEVAP